MTVQQATPVRFAEVQRFRQPWAIAFVVGTLALVAWAVVQQLVLGIPWGNNPASDGWLIVIAIAVLLLPAFILSINLRTEVRADGVYVRFWPLHLRWVRIPADSIQEAQALTYSPLRDYGGWGIRWGARGKAYNVSGNRGVLLVYGDGRRLLIGSQRADELAIAIASVKGRA